MARWAPPYAQAGCASLVWSKSLAELFNAPGIDIDGGPPGPE
jgi:hypothetical protein